MEPILNLSPEQFRAALAELQLDPAREAMLVEQYNAANAPQQGGRDRGMLRNLLDNIIGFDDEVVTPGERLGAGVEQFAGGLLSDPLGTGAGILQGGYETIERAMAPGATPMDVMGAAGMAMGAGGLLARPAGSVGMGGRVARDFDVSRRDASNIFGEGSERVRYTDPQSGGTMEVVVRPNGQASVLELEVPDEFRGQGIGQSLQARVMQDFPVMGGQVSSKAAATTAYRLGRRPYGQPDATLEDVFRIIDEDSSVNLISPAAQPTDLAANRSTATGLLASAASDTPAQRVARLLREGRADEVTDDLMAQADPQEMFRLYEAGETGMDLPMDEASRMVRAREMGVNTPGYHGSNVDFPAFRGMTYSSRTPEIADRYADDGVMYPIMTRSSDMATSAEENRIASNILSQSGFQGLGPQRSAISQELKRRGFAGVDDAVTALTFDPTNIRSRFARFDPRLSHLANLNAANVDPLTGAAAVSASQQDDPLANLRAYIAAAGGVLPR
jgi:predicted GNAT family acetyltransferase